MRKILLVVMVFTAIVSCKDDQKKEVEATSEEKAIIAEDGKTLKQSDGLVAIQGKFLYDEAQNAAVFLTPNQMYGIVLDDMAKALDVEVQKYKTDKYTMVPVTVRGRIFENEGATTEWEFKIEIKEILKVSEPSEEENDVIKLGSK
jgi:hypothetical protein